MTTARLGRRDLKRLAEEAFAPFDKRGVRGAGDNRFAAQVGAIDVTLRFISIPGAHDNRIHAACFAPVTLDDSEIVVSLRPSLGATPCETIFDRLFDIEIAPMRIAHSVFGPRTRKRLVALHPCTLTLDEGILTLEVMTGPVSDVKRLRKMLRTVALLAERLPRTLAAHEALDVVRDPEEEEEDDDSAYRGPSPERVRAGVDERERAAMRAERAEVAALVRVRRTRDFRRALKTLAVLVALVVGLLWLFSGRRRPPPPPLK